MEIQVANWILGLTSALLALGVAGLWKLSNVVSTLSARVEDWTKIFEHRFVAIGERTDEHEKRIGALETHASVNRLLIDRLSPSLRHGEEGVE